MDNKTITQNILSQVVEEVKV